MTPEAEVFAKLSTSGIPGTKVAWQLGCAPPPPYFVYCRDEGGDLFADDLNYALLPRFRAELYMGEYDAGVRETFSDAVASVGPYTTNESWIPGESAYMVAYEFTWHPSPED